MSGDPILVCDEVDVAYGPVQVLFGLDLTETAAQVQERWAWFRGLPLTPVELRTVATNLAPYLRP